MTLLDTLEALTEFQRAGKIRYIGGKTRDGIVLHDELVAWVERNSVVGSPRRG